MNFPIDSALKAFAGMQQRLNLLSAQSWDDGDDVDPRRLRDPQTCCSRVSAVDLGGLLAVTFHGDPHVGWDDVAALLADSQIAPLIALLHLDGPDEGANGLRSWDLDALIEPGQPFPALLDFRIAPSDPGDHNQAVVEDDQLPDLIALMPALNHLVLPQAPEPGFFELDLPDLRSIRTGGDFRTRGFIRHLAGARLPSLQFVDFTDSLAPFLDHDEQPPEWSSTPFADYQRLFAAPIMDQCGGFRIRNARLTEAQYRALAAIRPQCQFSVILDPPHCYVAHWTGSSFPYRHLLPFG